MMTFKKMAALSGLALMALISTEGMACDCMRASGERLLSYGKEVFIGTVVESDGETFPSVKVEVEKAYKGQPTGTVAVASSKSDCFVSLEVGARVLVTTDLARGGFVNQCSTFVESDSEYQRLVTELEGL